MTMVAALYCDRRGPIGTAPTSTKLGHCVDCEHYRAVQATLVQSQLLGCSMRDKHSDGTTHDFDWATYTDERMSSGVCRCGLYQIHFDTARMP